MKSFIVTILALAALTATAYSQKEPNGFSLGLTANYCRSMHIINLPAMKDNPYQPYFTNGTSNGYSLGLSFEWDLGGFRLNPGFRTRNTNPLIDYGFIGKIAYESLPGYFEAIGWSYPKLISQINGNDTLYSVSNLSTKWTSEIKYNVISADLLFRFNFSRNLGITIGPTFIYTLENHYLEKYILVEPLNAQFSKGDLDSFKLGREPLRYEDNNRTMIYEDAPFTDVKKLNIGVTAGLQYEINFSFMKIVPFVSYRFGVTNIKYNPDWKLNALRAGLDARIFL